MRPGSRERQLSSSAASQANTKLQAPSTKLPAVPHSPGTPFSPALSEYEPPSPYGAQVTRPDSAGSLTGEASLWVVHESGPQSGTSVSGAPPTPNRLHASMSFGSAAHTPLYAQGGRSTSGTDLAPSPWDAQDDVLLEDPGEGLDELDLAPVSGLAASSAAATGGSALLPALGRGAAGGRRSAVSASGHASPAPASPAAGLAAGPTVPFLTGQQPRASAPGARARGGPSAHAAPGVSSPPVAGTSLRSPGAGPSLLDPAHRYAPGVETPPGGAALASRAAPPGRRLQPSGSGRLGSRSARPLGRSLSTGSAARGTAAPSPVAVPPPPHSRAALGGAVTAAATAAAAARSTRAASPTALAAAGDPARAPPEQGPVRPSGVAPPEPPSLPQVSVRLPRWLNPAAFQVRPHPHTAAALRTHPTPRKHPVAAALRCFSSPSRRSLRRCAPAGSRCGLAGLWAPRAGGLRQRFPLGPARALQLSTPPALPSNVFPFLPKLAFATGPGREAS
jgi:hypothetical protein